MDNNVTTTNKVITIECLKKENTRTFFGVVVRKTRRKECKQDTNKAIAVFALPQFNVCMES